LLCKLHAAPVSAHAVQVCTSSCSHDFLCIFARSWTCLSIQNAVSLRAFTVADRPINTERRSTLGPHCCSIDLLQICRLDPVPNKLSTIFIYEMQICCYLADAILYPSRMYVPLDKVGFSPLVIPTSYPCPQCPRIRGILMWSGDSAYSDLSLQTCFRLSAQDVVWPCRLHSCAQCQSP